MSSIESLVQRMRSEFEAAEGRARTLRNGSLSKARARDAALERFGDSCDRLREVWRPRLEAFARAFGEKVNVTPAVTPARREVAMAFRTPLAWVSLRLSASPALETSRLVLEYELDILPTLMEVERHARLEMPLDGVDEDAVGRWIDDRLIAFLRAYHAMHENEAYLKHTLVEDPVNHVRFPQHLAAGSVTCDGKTVHFLSTDTMREFERQRADAKAAPAAESRAPKPPAGPSAGGKRPASRGRATGARAKRRPGPR